MKRAFKTIGIFLSAILLLASCSSDDDEPEMKNSANEGVVYNGHGEAVNSSPLSVFLSEELRLPYWDVKGLGHYTFFSYKVLDGHIIDYLQDSCIVINSIEEFRLAYHGTKTIPEINFTNNTLLICRTHGSDISRLGEVGLSDQGDEYELRYKILHYLERTSLCVEWPIYYWRLSPKLQKKPIVMIRKDIHIGEG
ncbi:hypothetical protein SAMN04487902_10438 [Prevotella sp. ne3005]|uniref:hypothetical protein n=1 Tax=Prevotella sp. ne3005 TaxID=1761887 RepID=UPI0008BE9F95|nr:hypothetical protein [Prevotella sp. ne3005]SEM84281.1 hypothetical protein SAMN04487902_10438 [Prevotella sp. ne3005]